MQANISAIPAHGPIKRLDGRYFGYLRDGKFLYRHDGQYIGWVDPMQNVFLASGRFLGHFRSPSYIVRITGMPTPPKPSNQFPQPANSLPSACPIPPPSRPQQAGPTLLVLSKPKGTRHEPR